MACDVSPVAMFSFTIALQRPDNLYINDVEFVLTAKLRQRQNGVIKIMQNLHDRRGIRTENICWRIFFYLPRVSNLEQKVWIYKYFCILKEYGMKNIWQSHTIGTNLNSTAKQGSWNHCIQRFPCGIESIPQKGLNLPIKKTKIAHDLYSPIIKSIP